MYMYTIQNEITISLSFFSHALANLQGAMESDPVGIFGLLIPSFLIFISVVWLLEFNSLSKLGVLYSLPLPQEENEIIQDLFKQELDFLSQTSAYAVLIMKDGYAM